jgi:hypothetical protein
VNEVECFYTYGGKLKLAFAHLPDLAEIKIRSAASHLNINNLSDVLEGNINPLIRTGGAAPTILFSTSLDTEKVSALRNYDSKHPQSVSRVDRRNDSLRMKMLIEMYKAHNIKWELSSQHIANIIDEKSTDGSKRFADRLIEVLNKEPKRYANMKGIAGLLFERRIPELLAKGGCFKQRLLTSKKGEVKAESVVTLEVIDLKHHSHISVTVTFFATKKLKLSTKKLKIPNTAK